MISSLEEVATPEVVAISLILAGGLNVLLIAVFFYAFGLEARRLMLISVGKGGGVGEQLTWQDALDSAATLLLGPCGGARGAAARRRQRELEQHKRQQQAASGGGQAAGAAAGPPAESKDGPVEPPGCERV